MDFYPRAQFKRDSWQDLDGTWQFEFDDTKTGVRDKWFANHTFSKEITVPFAYQSEASGIHSQEVHDCIWYGKAFTVDPTDKNQIKLHFGASDYYTRVWVNGTYCGSHTGGHSPFSFDITSLIQDDQQVKLIVCVEDDSFDEYLPRGKQNFKGKAEGIFYTGTTGIWQSVWLEFLNDTQLESVKLLPNTLTNSLSITAKLKNTEDAVLLTKIYRNQELIAENSTRVLAHTLQTTIDIPDFNDHHYGHWWSPDTPNLYDVEFTLLEKGSPVDVVTSYFGMRTVSVEGNKLCLNHLPFYTKSVLYQGYYPGSLMTAKSDAEIKQDLLLIKEMGFNSIRLHQKYENPRLLYWCDHLGLMVWGEAANAYSFNTDSMTRLTQEWVEIVQRDFNHPSICVWVPLNESWGIPKIKNDPQQQHFATALYSLTKALDSSRLVISNDGWEHTISDICTIHDYEADLTVLHKRYSSIEAILEGPQNRLIYVDGYTYENQPLILSEFGGIAFDSTNYGNQAWGYSGAASKEDFEEKVLAMIQEVQQSALLQGYCYTQFNDLEQEVNGLVTMSREPKLSVDALAKVNQLK